MKSVCYLGDGLNACGGSKTAVTAGTRVDQIKFTDVDSCFTEESFC